MKKINVLLAIAMTTASFFSSCSKDGAASTRVGDTQPVVFVEPAPLSGICDSCKTKAHMAAHPERWKAAFDFIKRGVEDGIAPGTYQLLPDEEVFAIVSEYEPRNADSCKFEAHRKYIDLQYIVSGREIMGITTPEGLVVSEPYVDDIEFYSADGVEACYTVADADNYFTFFPDDPHRPSIKDTNSSRNEPVKKIVVKIKF